MYENKIAFCSLATGFFIIWIIIIEGGPHLSRKQLITDLREEYARKHRDNFIKYVFMKSPKFLFIFFFRINRQKIKSKVV